MERCLKCKFRTCAENKKCEIKNYKYINQYRKLDNYVYLNLKDYGNALLSKKDYRILGERKIKEDLEHNGFNNIHFTYTEHKGVIVWAEKEGKNERIIQRVI